MTLRVLHFSDVHVQQPVRQLGLSALFSKRFIGGANLALHRAARFADAPAKLHQLDVFRREQNVDVVVCTGDYTALGTEGEYALARRCIDPLTRAPAGFVTVPGNHDIYLDDCVEERRFERHFGDLVKNDWQDAAVDGPWPAVRLFGEHLAVVAVNTARPNPSPINSGGELPAAQLEALARVLEDERLGDRWLFVATHYAPLREDGTPDTPHHGLDNADELGALLSARPRTAWLHGHIHWRYAHPCAPGQRPWVFGAGSATYRGREGLWLYEVADGRVRAIPGAYGPAGYRLEYGQALALTS